MFDQPNIERVSATPDSDSTKRIAALTEACIARVDGMADRPSDWTEESALAHWATYLFRIAWARFPDDAQARAEEAFELGTYYRPDAWGDGQFGVRDWMYEIAEDWDNAPRLVSIEAMIRERDLLDEAQMEVY